MRYILHTRHSRLIMLILIGALMGALSMGTTPWVPLSQPAQGQTVPPPPPPPDPDLPPIARGDGGGGGGGSSSDGCPAGYEGVILAEVLRTDPGHVGGDVLTGRVNLEECLIREVATDIKPVVDEVGCTQLALIPISPSQFVPPPPALTDGKPVILAQVLERRMQTCEGETITSDQALNQALPLSFRFIEGEVAAVNADPSNVFVLRYVPEFGTWTRIPSYTFMSIPLPHTFAHPTGTGFFALALHFPAGE